LRRRAGIAALAASLVLPEVAVIFLVGLAISWFFAGVIAFGMLTVIVAFRFARSRPLLAELFGAGAPDPMDAEYWTPRYLLIRPLVIGLPMTAALILAAFLAADFSYGVAAAVAVPGVLAGFPLGAWIWLWLENRDEA
jgi:hypothetical protein